MPLGAKAQQAAKLPTIGFLGPLSQSTMASWTTAFVQRLRDLGWVDGRTITIEYRWADGKSERLADIAAEFVRQKVTVIVPEELRQLLRQSRRHRSYRLSSALQGILFASA